MLNGDILMLIFFFVNKIIFPEREAKKYRNNFRYYVQKPSAVRQGLFVCRYSKAGGQMGTHFG